MDTKMIIEIIGYIGSALVLVSMLMTSVVRLRIINLTGSIIFAGYALAIRSYPTAVMNIALAGVNIYHLIKIFREQKVYTLVKTDIEDGYFSHLLKDADSDIRSIFPEYGSISMHPDITYLITCESVPACLFMGEITDPGRVRVLLDYAMPAYRDTTVGRYLNKCLAAEGYKTLVFDQSAEKHVSYLEKTGYRMSNDNVYELDLTRAEGSGQK